MSGSFTSIPLTPYWYSTVNIITPQVLPPSTQVLINAFGMEGD